MRKILSWFVWWAVYMVLACPAVLGALKVASKIQELIDPSDDE